jgi:hypothetical protein
MNADSTDPAFLSSPPLPRGVRGDSIPGELYTLEEVQQILKAAIAREEGTAKGAHARYARRHYFNQEMLSFIFCYNRPPGPAVLEPLGLEKVIMYRRKSNGNSRKT